MDWNAVRPATTLSLPERLSVDLERLILDGALAPGDRLPPERELAEYFGVSRVSVREALRELENRALIDRKPGRGTVVLAPGERSAIAGRVGGAVSGIAAELRDIFELREIIEPQMARITAQRATARDLTQLRELVEAMEADTESAGYVELDRAFHQAIAQYTHNSLLERINEQIALQVAPSREQRFQTRERRQASSRAHRRMYEAIAQGDGELAAAEARAHVREVADQVGRSHSDAATAEAVRPENAGAPGEPGAAL